MEILILLGVLILGFVMVGSIIAFTNLSGIRGLKADVKKLKHTVNYQRTLIEKLLARPVLASPDLDEKDNKEPLPGSAELVFVPTDGPSKTSHQATSATTKHKAMAMNANADDVKTLAVTPASAKPVSAIRKADKKKETNINFSLDSFLMGNGLLWLGAIVLALGGIFLAKYSIEAGLFPPSLRILTGVAFGILLIVAAEFLYTHPKRFQINSSMISAALASGGVITCFAMTLVAFDFYAFLSPLIAFVILAIIATAATWMSVRYGPILALVGVVGAYIVPALVSTGSNNVFALLVYVGFVSVSTMWVHALVKQLWLWWLSVLGHFGWLFVSVSIGYYDYQWVIFSYCLLSVYLYVLAPILGIKLNQIQSSAMSIKSLLMPRKEQLGIVLPVLALILANLALPFSSNLLLMLSILSAVLLMTPFRHSAFDSWPFIALGLCVLVFLKMPISYDYTDNLFPFTSGYMFIQTCAAGFIIYAMFALKFLPHRPSYLLLLILAPMLLMGLAYAISDADAAHYLYPVWSIELMSLACIFGYLSIRANNNVHKMTYLMLANGAFTLTLTMLLSTATLSLAVVAQVALMAFLSNKFKMTLPNWLYKVAISLVLLRLSAAPWLQQYSGETILGMHWSIVIYPLVLLLLWLTYTFVKKDDVKVWLTGAMLHVIALFVTTETSFLISGSYPNPFNFTYVQAILLSMNWLILGAVYLWRRKSASKPFIYVAYSSLLIGVSAALHVYLSVLASPFLFKQYTGEGTFINWLIPLWAVPAIVLGVMLYARLVHAIFRKPAWAVLSIFIASYINGAIRSIYHSGISFVHFNIGQQELYMYSIVWLIIAAALIVFAQRYTKELVNKVGFCILALVVLKAFLIDMSNLDGLYRALSFIGLGLCLVGIGWLFQRFKHKVDSEHPTID